MSQICAISKERHVNSSWRLPETYRHAATDAVVLLVTSELPSAMMNYPLAFVESEQGFRLVGVQGIDPKTNLQVSAQGKWIGSYLPKHYQHGAFLLANTSEGGKALCVDESLGLVGVVGEGEPFFQDDGEPTAKVADMLKTLVDFEKEKAAIGISCATLSELALIEPWALKLDDGKTQRQVQGLFKINETRLNQLRGDQLEQLRDVGGLVLAYCQLLSMQNMQKLARQYLDRRQADQQGKDNLQASGLSVGSDLLSFDNL